MTTILAFRLDSKRFFLALIFLKLYELQNNKIGIFRKENVLILFLFQAGQKKRNKTLHIKRKQLMLRLSFKFYRIMFAKVKIAEI